MIFFLIHAHKSIPEYLEVNAFKVVAVICSKIQESEQMNKISACS